MSAAQTDSSKRAHPGGLGWGRPRAGALGAAPSLGAPGGSRKFKPKSRFGAAGLVVMVAAHALIGYGLATGLARQAVEFVKKPLNATIIQEVKLPPPPPPPPPKIEKIKQAPKAVAPPPLAYVPPPDVQTAVVNPAPAITAVQNTQPVASPAPAPVAPALVAPAPAKAEIALVCPKQVKPEIPKRAIDNGISGTVKAEARVRSGKVVDVKILSGPNVFHASVRAAMLHYECSAGEPEITASQVFTFKVD